MFASKFKHLKNCIYLNKEIARTKLRKLILIFDHNYKYYNYCELS